MTEAKTAEQKAEAPKADAPKHNVGTVACAAILAGKSNDETLKLVMAAFPEAKTTLSSINWYRNNLRKNGKDVPKARELSKAAKDGEKAAAKAEKDKAKADKKAKDAADKAAAKQAKADKGKPAAEAKDPLA